MSYGELHVICGPMFSGKTTFLLNSIERAKQINDDILVIKPAFDNRYSESKIVSHDGRSADAFSIFKFPDFPVNSEYLFFDEIQFFCAPHFKDNIIEKIRIFLSMGKNIVACGLDTNWMGYPFEVTASLVAMADKVTKLKSRCSVCKSPASKTFKKSDSKNIIELGSNDKYEPRCNKHWLINL